MLFLILLLCSPALYAMAPQPPRFSDKALKARARELFETLNNPQQSLSCANQIVDAHLNAVPNTQDKQYLLRYGLRLAVEKKCFDLAKLYLLFGADQNEPCFCPGNTSLLGSITGRFDRQLSNYKPEDAAEQVAFLLKYGANPHPPDMLSYSPLDHQLTWFNDDHNLRTDITYAVCKMLFAYGARAKKAVWEFHLNEEQRYEFVNAKKEQEDKIRAQELEILIPIQDYYFLLKKSKHYDPSIVCNFQERHTQAVHNMLPLPAPLAALITAYCAVENPDIALLALRIRKNQLLGAQQHEESETPMPAAADPKAEERGCWPSCIIQ